MILDAPAALSFVSSMGIGAMSNLSLIPELCNATAPYAGADPRPAQWMAYRDMVDFPQRGPPPPLPGPLEGCCTFCPRCSCFPSDGLTLALLHITIVDFRSWQCRGLVGQRRQLEGMEGLIALRWCISDHLRG